MSLSTAIPCIRSQIDEAAQRARSVAGAARERSHVVDAAFGAYERDRRTAGSVLAGAVAFRLFVYLLPLYLALLALAGAVAGLDEDSPREVGQNLGLSSYVIDSVQTAVEQSRRSLWVLVPLALWAIYTGGVGTAKVLRAIHALAWEQPIERLRRGTAAAAVTFLAALTALAMIGGLSALREQSARLGLLFMVVCVIPFAALWLLVSLLLPRDPRAPWTALLPGAVLIGTTVWVVHLVTVYWFAHRVQSASEMYGSLGVAAAILAWLYLFGRLMVAAAMLNATLWQRRQTTPEG